MVNFWLNMIIETRSVSRLLAAAMERNQHPRTQHGQAQRNASLLSDYRQDNLSYSH